MNMYKVSRTDETTGKDFELYVDTYEEAIALLQKFYEEDIRTGHTSGISMSKADGFHDDEETKINPENK